MSIFVFISLFLAAVHANNSYVVISPAKVRPSMNLEVSVHIIETQIDPVNVDILLIDENKSIASGNGNFNGGEQGSVQIQVPSEITGSSLTLKVQGTGGLTFEKTETVKVQRKELSVFVQTDKAIYKPKDKVRFRVFGVYPNLKSYSGPLQISVKDAGGNKIKQWLDVLPTNNGVIEEQFILSDQPVLGEWTISANADASFSAKKFEVAEYVLPKFEITVKPPSYVLESDDSADFVIKAKYTYGKPVKGYLKYSVKLHYKYQRFGSTAQLPFAIGEMPIDGEATVNVLLADAKKRSRYLVGRIMTISVNITEDLTGNKLEGNGSVEIHRYSMKLEFPDTNAKTFKPGLQYKAVIKVTRPDGSPVHSTNKQVTITGTETISHPTTPNPTEKNSRATRTTQKLVVNPLHITKDGLASLTIDINENAVDVNIQAVVEGESYKVYSNLRKSHSPSGHYIQLALVFLSSISNTGPFGSGMFFRVRSTEFVRELTYQVLSRGNIVASGVAENIFFGQNEFNIYIPTTPRMAPNSRIVAYYVRPDGEIVTDSLSFDVDGVFENKVSVSVNDTDVEPSDPLKVTVSADANSHAFLAAIDQSVLILRSGNDVTTANVNEELKTYDTIDKNVYDGPIIMPFREKRRAWLPYPIYFGGSDASTIFKNAGVIVITDATVHKEKPKYIGCRGFDCPVFDFGPALRRRPEGIGGPEMMNMAARPLGNVLKQKEGGAAKDSKELKEVDHIRKVFSESFLWTDTAVGGSRQADVTAIVPDTITSWVISAFALNTQSGLGIAPTNAQVTVFKPFFVSLNLPYSVTRGEQVGIQAIVFNYMKVNQSVTVTLSASNKFQSIYIDDAGIEHYRSQDEQQTIKVSAGKAESVTFWIVPSDLGKVKVNVRAQSYVAADAVERDLLVEAEGVPKELNLPVLVDLTETNTFTKTVDVVLPDTVVQGSELVKISVVGDMMGPSIQGLDSLLKMPTGCGEQTMLSLAPDVYIVEYLKSTNQLDGEIQDKALTYMEKGYQRELTYKHNDGSFSAFGKSDSSGSTWLTAFVSRVFHQAQPHIFIDTDVLFNASQWLISHQNANGSFAEPGRVIHKAMQGKADKGVGLTIFVFLSLLENQDLFVNTPREIDYKNAVDKALAYIESEIAKTDDLYVLCMASYALVLANSNQATTLLNRLQSLATKQDGLTYWQYPKTTTTNTGGWNPHPTRGVDTEMTSYVLLAYAHLQDVANGKSIINWVVQQRNPKGGFSSTQDTVVALNALSEFARLTQGNIQMQITTTLIPTAHSYSFTVNQNNAAVTQRRENKTVPSQVKVDASGSGLALVEVGVFFNVLSEVEEPRFLLTVTSIQDTTELIVLRACARWIGEGEASGMAIMEVGLPSGFEAERQTLSDISTLKRVEYLNKKLVIYFDEINTTNTCVTVTASQVNFVAKALPVAVRVYDYYEPTNQVTEFYQKKSSSVCDVTSSLTNCAKRKR